MLDFESGGEQSTGHQTRIYIGSPLSDSPDLVLVENVSSLKLAWLPYRRRVNEEG